MKRLLPILLLLIPISLIAQNYDALKKQSTESYLKYKAQKEDKYRAYREQQNKQFESFLRESWEQMYSHEGFPKPKGRDKDVPPVVYDEKQNQPTPLDNPIPFETIPTVPTPAPSPTPIAPIEENLSQNEKTASFELYGTPLTVRYPGTETLQGIDESSVAAFWSKLCDQRFDNMLHDCLLIKQERSLCDWAFLKLVDNLSKTIYGSDLSSSAVVFQAYILTQAGFRIYLARDTQNHLHKLITTDRDLYVFPYLDIDGRHCFIIDGTKEQSFRVMNKTFEGTTPMSISLVKENHFATKMSKTRTLQSKRYPVVNATVSTNVNLIEFYNEYPESVTNNDFTTRWRFYANTPLSSQAKSSLYPKLKSIIGGKKEYEAVSILLDFVQTAFEYEYDDVVWGRDRAFFADESLYYPFCDCEDRSILFSRLVRDLLSLNVVLIYYPGHIATAVCFNDDVKGDYLLLKERKYVVCDPTYIGAPVGLSMPDLDYNAAIVIPLN